MSNEQLVEEILYESYSLGVYDQVMSLSNKMKDTNPRMSIYDRYNEALQQVKFDLVWSTIVM